MSDVGYWLPGQSDPILAPYAVAESDVIGHQDAVSLAATPALPRPNETLLDDAATPDEALGVPDHFAKLLSYLRADVREFEEHEDRYFARLTELLVMAGTVDPISVINRTNFHEPVEAFQRQAKLASPDGIPGKNTLWELQYEWAIGRNLAAVALEADIWTPTDATVHVEANHGYRTSTFREDVVPFYNQLLAELREAGALLTSATTIRPLDAEVSPGRSASSMHYSGLAMDLSTVTGMHDVENEPFLIEHNGGRYWQVWARAEHGNERTIKAVKVENGRGKAHDGVKSTVEVKATVVDFTEMAHRWGFDRIGHRGSFPGNYYSAEWWHFQANHLLVPWISQFGTEVLSLADYTESDLKAQKPVWNERKRIFRKDWN